MLKKQLFNSNRTPGTPPGIIPQPAAALLGTIWYPDGSNANYDEGTTTTAVKYSEGFAGLPKPEGASATKTYVDHSQRREEQATPQIKWYLTYTRRSSKVHWKTN